MLDKANLHQEVQAMCDCQATNDPLKEMSEINNEEDKSQAAVKWLALAVLHGINANLKKITLSKTSDGQVKVVAKHRETELPPISPELAEEILADLRAITHFEGKKGKGPLALGIRNDSLQLEVKLEESKGESEMSLKFPK